MSENIYGLKRDIPSATKRLIRQQCGYGCVICGNAIYQYEHIDPPFTEAKKHDADKMALLCGACHEKVTLKLWSKGKVLQAKEKPKPKEVGFSNFSLDIQDDLVVTVGNTRIKNLENIIQIDGKQILGIKKPETDNSPPQITAHFFDRKNNQIASIIDNEWRGSPDTFDIETKGNSITVRSESRKIDLSIKIVPPHEIAIDKLNLRYNGKTIKGSSTLGFVIESENSTMALSSDNKTIEKAPHWLSIEGSSISLGTDAVIEFVSSTGEKSKLPGAYKVESAGLEFIEPEEGEALPPGFKKGDKIQRLSFQEGGQLSMEFDVPQPQPVRQKAAVINKPPNGRSKTKLGRNDPCYCGSGKKYKKCHLDADKNRL